MKAFGTLAALAAFVSCTLFLAGTGSMRRIELMGAAPFGAPQPAQSYVHLSDNNGFGTNAAFIDKGNLPEGMADETRGAVLVDKHVQNVAPEGGYIADQAVGSENTLQQKVEASSDAAPQDGVVHLSDNHGFGTNAAFIHKHDGEGTSVSDDARMEQLVAKGTAKGKGHPKGFGYLKKLHKGARLIKKPKVFFEKKAVAPTQMLSQQYLEFGQKARNWYVKHHLMSQAADDWAKKMGTGWEKAPVQMLAQVAGKQQQLLACGDGGPCPAGPAFIRKSGLTSNAEVAWSKGFDVENAADKAPTTMLAQKSKGLACGRGGPCPDGPAFIRKSGLTSAAEVAWSKGFPVENAADKAPMMMLKQQGNQAARQVAKDVASYLFTASSQAGL